MKVKENAASVIDPPAIHALLGSLPKPDPGRFREVLEKASLKKGLSLDETAFLLTLTDHEMIREMTETAVQVKDAIYGKRLVLFAPLYSTSHCINDCEYCGFRVTNACPRRRLSLEEIRQETEVLIRMGHKRILLVGGEDPELSVETVAAQVRAIYDVRIGSGNIRRINVNIAPQSEEGFRKIKDAGIGTYQCFQETYHPETYARLHLSGPKCDFENRLRVFERCIKAGIDDFGVGFLFGLYDHRYEVLALLQQTRHLEANFGIGPHTISIPRLEPAEGTDYYRTTPWKVSDEELVKTTAILRLSVPYTGIILSTRESPEMRHRLLRVGVSQISAGSITNPGGYAEVQGPHPSGAAGDGEEKGVVPQFEVQDHRSLDEIIRMACDEGYIPSFCTGCYRKGRTGEVFQHLAKDEHIGPMCTVNAFATLQEYLEDYASQETKDAGTRCIRRFLGDEKDPGLKNRISEGIRRVKTGERDVIV